MRVQWLAIIVFCTCALVARAGTGRVATVDGQHYEGELKIEAPNTISVIVSGSEKLRVETSRLLEAIFREPAPARPLQLPKVEPASPNNALPTAWREAFIGMPNTAGQVKYRVEQRGQAGLQPVFGFSSMGMGFLGRSDSCHFVYQTLDGDGEVFCQANVQNSSPQALGGVMLRSSEEPDAVFVALVMAPNAGSAYLIWRSEKGAESQRELLPDQRYQPWVKLERSGNKFSAYRSRDGTLWEFAEAVEILLPQKLLAGAMASSGKENVKNYSHIANLFVFPLVSQGLAQLVLTNGSVLPGKLAAAEAPALRFECMGRALALATNMASRILFTAISEDVLARVPKGKTGVLLRKGEFIEGSLLFADAVWLKVKTRTKGELTLKQGSEVVALVLQESVSGQAAYEVRTVEGGILLAQKLELHQGFAAVQLDGLATFSIPEISLQQIKRIGNPQQVAASPAPAQIDTGPVAGRLQTKSGEKVDGLIRFENNTVLVSGKGQAERRFLFDELTFLSLESALNPERPIRNIAWSGVDVGTAPERGGHRFDAGGQVTIESAGKGIQKNRDSFYFVHFPFEGNVEIIARLARIENGGNVARAGLMMRSQLEDSAANVFGFYMPESGAAIQSRLKSGLASSRDAWLELGLPVWLRMERDGRNFLVYASADGQNWKALGRREMEMPGTIFIGMALSSSQSQGRVSATFDNILIRRRQQKTFKPLVTLRTGSEIPATIVAADDTTFKIVRTQREEWRISTINVARLVCPPMTSKEFGAAEPARTGVLLRNGDFVDGEFQKLDGDIVKIRSTVFGLRSYKQPAEVAAVIFRDPTASGMAELRFYDGMRLFVQSVRLRGDYLELKEPVLGELILPASELVEYRLLGGAMARP